MRLWRAGQALGCGVVAQLDYSLPLDSNASCVQVLPVGPFSNVEMSVKPPAPAHPLMMTATIAEMNSRMACLADDPSNAK